MKRIDIERSVNHFITETFLLGDTDGMNTNTSLMETGIIDSTGVMELVLFVEKFFKIELANEDLIPENFDTVKGIGDLIERKLTSPPEDSPSLTSRETKL